MISVILASVCLTAGCDFMEKKEDMVQIPKYQLEVQSKVEQEGCFICGKHSESLMPYYEKKDSIGLIHWNSGMLMDTEVRTYDDEGNEVISQESNMKTNSFGDKGGTVMINPMPNHGISEVMVTYTKKDEVNFDLLKQKLCQGCLDQVIGFYVDQKNFGEDGHVATTGYCLVDFQTKQLYSLSDPYSVYFIRDYYINYEIKEDNGGAGNRIEIQIFYAPERDL